MNEAANLMMTFRRYARAFWLALRMTARGQQPPALEQPALLAWVRQLNILVEAAYAAADQAHFDAARRESLTLRLDGRVMSFDGVLAALRYHAQQEYPSLLRSGSPHNHLAVYASNVNDRYWLSSMLDSPALDTPALRQALVLLLAHLDALPAFYTEN